MLFITKLRKLRIHEAENIEFNYIINKGTIY